MINGRVQDFINNSPLSIFNSSLNVVHFCQRSATCSSSETDR